jgi:cell division protein FtsA
MNSKPIVCALDIGSTKVSILVAEATSEGLKVLGQSFVKHGGVKQGAIVDIGMTTEAIKKAKREAELSSGHEIKNVYVSIGGMTTKSFDSTGLAAVENDEVSQIDVENAMKTAKAVLLPEDREIIHALPKEYILDGLDEITNPVGMQGVRLESKVHLIAGARPLIQNITKSVENAGLIVKDFVLQQYASSLAVLSKEEKNLGVCLIEMGGGTSEWIIYKHGVVVATGAVAVGGLNFTNDLSVGLRTSPANSERIKLEHGECRTENVSDEFIEVQEVGSATPRSISKKTLADIIGPRALETMSLIAEDIEKSGMMKDLGAGVVFTGGGCKLSGLIECAREMLDVPVKIAGPSLPTTTSDVLDSAETSCAAGLLQFGYSKLNIKKKKETTKRGSAHKGASLSTVAAQDTFKSFGKQFKDFIGL